MYPSYRKRQRQPWQDTMQVCLNGHVINDGYRKHPEYNQARCNKCGAETITDCPNCNSFIPGKMQDTGAGILGLGRSAPKFCQHCGERFSWTEEQIASIRVGDATLEKIPSDSSELQTRPFKADILLVTVTKVEALAVLTMVEEKFGHEYKTLHIGQKTYYNLGTIGRARICMVRSEMGTGGPGGSFVTVSEGIKALSPSAIVMVGIAFGVDSEKQQVGDILVSKQVLCYEFQRVSSGTDDELVIIPRGDRPSVSPRLLDRFRHGELSWNGPRVRFGLVLSGDKLIDNQDFRSQLRELEPEAIGGEMEGAGLYSAAFHHKTDWILVKAICDWADGKKHENESLRQEEAARNAANFAIHVIEQGGFVETGQSS